ncbi:hypothetical protein A1O7_08533 [Cladophialophora yegresii CBS 114405]|uniref:VOC domain-containing protein n=1 Tax=Cladophialophora yegresii CBS 114405 TaxID=1182544 RepID=W9VRG1_9EURO|nr:uncharacterized protein A1O7_08533 [Cladophialophora yegresii CBS 114405]EXJ55605.1 hypothetical protein A1O7_08533 [Cladophialophora yegresii CBS 114405]
MAQNKNDTDTRIAPAAQKPPAISHILETCLMVKDIAASTDFYKTVFGIDPFMNNARMSGFALSQTTLLLFQLGATALDSEMPANRGTIPGHGPSQDILNLVLSGSGSDSDTGISNSHPSSNRNDIPGRLNQHFCLAVTAPEDVQVWEKWLEEKKVQILGKVNWPRGGKSVYFSDLDGNVGEIASRGIWEHY